MSDYQEIFKSNVFKNQDRFADGTPMSGGKPQFSNNKITLHSDIPAGEYSLGIWQYADTGNLSLKITTRPATPGNNQPAQDNGDIDDCV